MCGLSSCWICLFQGDSFSGQCFLSGHRVGGVAADPLLLKSNGKSGECASFQKLQHRCLVASHWLTSVLCQPGTRHWARGCWLASPGSGPWAQGLGRGGVHRQTQIWGIAGKMDNGAVSYISVSRQDHLHP